MIKDSNDDEHTIRWTIFIISQIIIRLYNNNLTFTRICWIFMCSISFCHSKWQKIKTGKHTCILIKLGTELPSRAGWMPDILHYLILPPKGNRPFTTYEWRQDLLPLTHSVLPFMLDTPFRCRASKSLFSSWQLWSPSSTSALTSVLCVLAENTSLHSTRGLMSRLKLISVQHFFPQHWRWGVSSSVEASREGNMVRAANQMLTHAGI